MGGTEALATHAFTRKLEVVDGKGETLVEILGAIHDLELLPGTTIAWYFYPMTNGRGPTAVLPTRKATAKAA